MGRTCSCFADSISTVRKDEEEAHDGGLALPDMRGAFASAAAFDLAAARLSIALGRMASGRESRAAEAFLRDMPDVTRLDGRHLSLWLSAALEHARRTLSGIPGDAGRLLGGAAPEVCREARRQLRAGFSLRVSPAMGVTDRRLLDLVVKSQANFVRDAMGRRLEDLGRKARQAVADGLEAGLGRADVARSLADTAKGALAGRSASYWDVVAGAFMGSGRTASQMGAYAEAGIHRYMIEAVLDEHTTETCRFLHGKTFLVEDALSRLQSVSELDDPMDVKSVLPWVREGAPEADGRRWLYAGQGVGRRPVAEVVRGAYGTKDQRGEYGRCVSDRQLADMGVSLPPFHGLCRTTTVPAD